MTYSGRLCGVVVGRAARGWHDTGSRVDAIADYWVDEGPSVHQQHEVTLILDSTQFNMTRRSLSLSV